jgi:hypothetical protein
MRMRICRTIWRPPASVKIDLGKLRNKEVAREFRQRTKESLESFVSDFDGVLSADEERRAIEDATKKTATDLLRAGKGRKRMGWCTAIEAVLMAVINRRNEAQKGCNESPDDQRPLSPKEVWQVIRALQKDPRLAAPITPLNPRKNPVLGTGALCETEAENGLPVRPGGLFRRGLDGTLSVSN